jgi:hypothetical protein
MRDVEKLVSGRKQGDRPNDPASPEAKRHTLRFDVSAEVLATFRDAMARLRRDSGGKLDDDEALLLMARHVLGGPADTGRSSYQVSVSVCERCRQSYQQSAGERIEISAEVAAMAECDAQDVGHTGHTRVDGPSGDDSHSAAAPTRVAHPFRRLSGAACWSAMVASAASPAAGMANTLICTTSNLAPRVAITIQNGSSRSVASITAPPTWGVSS